MLNALVIVLAAIGLASVLISFMTFTRSSDNEVSRDFHRKPTFVLGIVLLLISLIVNIVSHMI